MQCHSKEKRVDSGDSLVDKGSEYIVHKFDRLTVSEAPEYKLAALHLISSSSCWLSTFPLRSADVNDVRAVPAACPENVNSLIQLNNHEKFYHLLLDKLEWLTDHITQCWSPNDCLVAETRARKPKGDVTYWIQISWFPNWRGSTHALGRDLRKIRPEPLRGKIAPLPDLQAARRGLWILVLHIRMWCVKRWPQQL